MEDKREGKAGILVLWFFGPLLFLDAKVRGLPLCFYNFLCTCVRAQKA
jgi:hypothetical protein